MGVLIHTVELAESFYEYSSMIERTTGEELRLFGQEKLWYEDEYSYRSFSAFVESLLCDFSWRKKNHQSLVYRHHSVCSELRRDGEGD